MNDQTFDTLIVPGSVRNRERDFRAIAAGYALTNDLAQVAILSGGRTKEVVESESMRHTLMREFPTLNPNRVVLEQDSTDTSSNFRNSLSLATPGKIGVLSSRFHLERCIRLAKNLGQTVKGISVEDIFAIYDKERLKEFTAYLESDEMRSATRLEGSLIKMLDVDPEGKIPLLTSRIYYHRFRR